MGVSSAHIKHSYANNTLLAGAQRLNIPHDLIVRIRLRLACRTCP
jgi:hypothetical protein